MDFFRLEEGSFFRLEDGGFLRLEEGGKAEFQGFVEFLGRGQVDSQFESRFGILVVPRGCLDDVSRCEAVMRRSRGFGWEVGYCWRRGFRWEFGFRVLRGDVWNGIERFPSSGFRWIGRSGHGRFGGKWKVGQGETPSKRWPRGGVLGGRFSRRRHVHVVIVQGQVQILVLVHPSKTFHH